MTIDTRKCVGCGDCVIACQVQNKVPEGYCKSWVTEAVNGKYPDVSLAFRSERCNHCSVPPCVTNCPTDSSYIAEGGIVLTDHSKCIGCGACVESCPYDARYFDPVEGFADKCTFCEHKLAKGHLPACVEVCPTQCMQFGDLDDPRSSVSLILKTRKHKTLKPHLGTEPNIYYLL